MKYRTIVADPPWDHSRGTGVSYGDLANDGNEHGPKRYTGLPYAHLDIEGIRSLPVDALAERDAHLYLWTTNQYLRQAYGVAEAWGFAVVKPLIWCKAPMGFMGAPYTSSVEFCLFCRRGSLPALTRAGRQWWEWKRGERSDYGHSAKPEAFLDIVEQVSPGPRLELFARRQRLGWDTWGDEALCHVDVASRGAS